MRYMKMKQTIVSVRLLVIAVSLLLLGCDTTTNDTSEHQVSTEQIVGTIQATLLEVDKRLGEQNAPELKQANLILNTTMSKTRQGQMALIPVSAQSGSSKSATGTLTINLKPAPELSSSASSKEYVANNDIVEAVVTSIQEISQVEQGPVPMKFEQVIAKLGFSISSTASGGVNIKVAKLSVGGQLSSSQSDNHTLELVFVSR